MAALLAPQPRPRPVLRLALQDVARAGARSLRGAAERAAGRAWGNAAEDAYRTTWTASGAPRLHSSRRDGRPRHPGPRAVHCYNVIRVPPGRPDRLQGPLGETGSPSSPSSPSSPRNVVAARRVHAARHVDSPAAALAPFALDVAPGARGIARVTGGGTWVAVSRDVWDVRVRFYTAAFNFVHGGQDGKGALCLGVGALQSGVHKRKPFFCFLPGSCVCWGAEEDTN